MKLKLRRSLGLALLLVGVLAGCNETSQRTQGTAEMDWDEGHWPQWRGPQRDGISTETGLLTEWPEGGPRLLWRTTGAGSGFSSLAISNGLLFTLGKRGGAEYALAYDDRTGLEVWNVKIGRPYSNVRGDGPRSTPTVDGDRVYVLGASGDLWCLAAATGKVVWNLNILETFEGESLKWGISESPLVDDAHVYVTSGGLDGTVVALNKDNGEVVWQSEELFELPSYASPIMATVDGVRQLILFTDRSAVGVRAADGALLWQYEEAANRTANCTTPVFHDNKVFLTSAYDTGAALLQLTGDGEGTRAEEVYFTRNMKNHHGGVILLDGHIYGFSDNILHCVDFETGEMKWRDRSVGKGSVTSAEGMLYILSEKGVVALIKAAPEGYREVSRFSIEVDGRESWAHMVIAGGRLYIRNGNEILCYDIKAG